MHYLKLDKNNLSLVSFEKHFKTNNIGSNINGDSQSFVHTVVIERIHYGLLKRWAVKNFVFKSKKKNE